jgi:hypothetical protein
VNLFPLVVVCVFAFAACGGRPDAGRTSAGGILEGAVYVTGPVEGATVTAYELDLKTGAVGSPIAVAEAPTDSEGKFSLALGLYNGALLLEATGVAARFIESATGTETRFEEGTRLRAVWTDWPKRADAPTFYFATETRDTVVVSPFTELAVRYAGARAEFGLSAPYEGALADSLALWRGHWEFEFWRVLPRDLANGEAGPWDETVHAGVLHVGLSGLARRIAQASQLSASAVSALAVTEALGSDLEGDAYADGCGKDHCASAQEHVRLGACAEPDSWEVPPICTLSGATLRAEMFGAVAFFLAQEGNRSGLSFRDVEGLMARICRRTLADPAEASTTAVFRDPLRGHCDTESPVVTVQKLDGGSLEPRAVVAGTIQFQVSVRDAVAMGAIRSVALSARGLTLEETNTSLQVTRSEVDPQTRMADVVFDTTFFGDGPVTLHVQAEDAQGNGSSFELALDIDNAGQGVVQGTVTAGGRVKGAQVVVLDVTGGGVGRELGRGTTDDEGMFRIEVQENPAVTALLLKATKPGDAGATYPDMAAATALELSDDDVLEVVLADWVDGDKRNVHITPWTTIGTAFARGLWDWQTSGERRPGEWRVAVDNAFGFLEAHVNDGGPYIDLRRVAPADLTVAQPTLTAAVRYGLLVAGLGQLALDHGAASSRSAAVMNTMSITRALSEDLSTGDAQQRPYFDGVVASPPGAEGPTTTVQHGDVTDIGDPAAVEDDGMWTRPNLALAIFRFLQENENNRSGIVEQDVIELLDHISEDDDRDLYRNDGIAYDREPPTVGFDDAFTPAADTPFRSPLTIRAVATDQRALDRATPLIWDGDGVRSDGVLWDQGSTRATLLGTVTPDCAKEGEIVLAVRAQDEALNTATATRRLYVDCTPPVAVSRALVGDHELAPEAWTGAASIRLEGTVTDQYGVAQVRYRWPTPSSALQDLPLAEGGAWRLEVPLEAGANVLTIVATDRAGNDMEGAPLSVTYYRDAEAPTVVPAATQAEKAKLIDEASCELKVKPDSVEYDCASGSSREVEDGVKFTKYLLRFLTADAPNLPEWRFDVSDNRSADDQVRLEVRVRRLRVPTMDQVTIIDWTSVPQQPEGSVVDRAFRIHGGLEPRLAETGVYTLEYRATDEFGNTSEPASVAWTQTVESPALYVRTTTPGGFRKSFLVDPDPITPGSQGLAGSESIVGIIHGRGETQRVRIAAWEVANPHAIPVRFSFDRLRVRAVWSIETQFDAGERGELLSGRRQVCPSNQYMAIEGEGCMTPQKAFGTRRSDANNRTGNLWNRETLVVDTRSGNPVPPCEGCSAREYELAPGQHVFVYAYSGVWTWLSFGGYIENWSYMRVGTPDPAWWGQQLHRHEKVVTGRRGAEFRLCENPFCTEHRRLAEIEYFRRVLVTYDPPSPRWYSRLPTTFVANRPAPGTAAEGVPGYTENLSAAEDDIRAPTKHSHF